jgi:hypothetical protein
MEFDSPLASAKLVGLGAFDAWRDKRFWKRRATDVAANASAPLKHMYQNVFAMTLAGAVLLHELESHGYHILLDSLECASGQCVCETYPRETARRIGFTGSYKQEPAACLARAEAYLAENGIKLDFDAQVRSFCHDYRTGGGDPDGADAFLCLVAAIALHEGLAEFCVGDAPANVLRQEAAIVVPRSSST